MIGSAAFAPLIHGANSGSAAVTLVDNVRTKAAIAVQDKVRIECLAVMTNPFATAKELSRVFAGRVKDHSGAPTGLVTVRSA